MKFFTNKSIWSKIIVILIFVLVVEFIIAKPSLGSEADKLELGGKLLAPFVSLLVTLADAGIEIMQGSIMGTEEALLHVDTSNQWWEFFKILVKVVVFAAAAVAFCTEVGLLGSVVAAAAACVFGDTALALFNSAIDKSVAAIKNSVFGVNKDCLPDDLYLPAYSISPEEIFQGNILLFNVDFFGTPKIIEKEPDDADNGKIGKYYYEEDNGEIVYTSPQDIGQELSGIISKWYVALRNIGLVMMLIILLYVGIRMLLSTMASDKARYKQMLQDWVMGLVILFSIHYIMVFSIKIVNGITKVVSSSVESDIYTVVMEDKDNKISDTLVNDMGFPAEGDPESFIATTEDDHKVISWPTNLMGSLRLRAQLAKWGTEYIGYAICFVVLVIFTGFFILTYMKRVLYMAFLTLIAPLVAVTYPIDKLNDGSAQGFNKWFKEYIFNLLIQPMHLLLYYILVTSAFELAGENVIYSLVAIGFMIPAEKILRSMFGFEKSGTAPSMATGAAVGMGLMQLMKPKPPKLAGAKKAIGASSSGGSSSSEASSGDNGTIHTPSAQFDTEETLAGIGLNSGQNKRDDNLIEDKNSQGSPTQQPQLDGQQAQQPQLDKAGADHGKLESNAGINADKDLAKTTIKKPEFRTRAKRFATVKGTQALSSMRNGARRAIRNTPGNLVRASGQLMGAGLGAGIGLAAGIAQGDLGKAATLAAGGATLGSSVGKGTGEILAKPIDSGWNKAVDVVADKTGYQGGVYETPEQARDRINNRQEYKQIQQYDEMKQKKKESKPYFKELYRNEKDGGKAKMEEMFGKGNEGGAFELMYSNGITDAKNMAAIQKMKDSGDINSYKEGIAISKASDEVGKEAKGTKAKDWNKEWKRRYQKQGLEKEQAKKAAEGTMDRINSFNSIRKKL